jgi:tetratricopeptide (TPR) repeat protein
MLGVLGVAAQLAIVAHAPDTVFACDAVELTVAVSASGRSIPSLIAPSFAPFDLLRGTTTPQVDFDSRARSAVLAEYRFTVTTDRVGNHTIPPFEARLGEERVRSRPVHVTVHPMRLRGLPTVVARARIDTSGDVNLRTATAPDTVFVGQQATYEVAVFLNQAVRDRLRRQPTFYPPEMQAMLAYDLPAVGADRRRVGSQCFDALVYRRALFPLVAGRLVIPPAQLVYSTGLSSSSLFSREESHELQTDSVAIIAVEPPLGGRPPEYAGTVGDVRLESRLDSVNARVGDPLLLTVRVMGTGNVKLFPRPSLRVPWAGLVAADERVRIDSGSARIGGEKEFDWVLTPRIAGEFDVPPVRYGYFDPARQRYDVAVVGGKRLRVAPGALASADTGQAESALNIRVRYGGPAWPPLQSRPEFWLALALIPVPAIVGRARRRAERAKRIAHPNPMRVLIGAAAQDSVGLRRQFVRALAQRLGCNPEDFTHPGALERALRRAGVSEKTATAAELLLRDLDAAAYAGKPVLPVNAARNAAVIARAVDLEALSRSELPFWIPALVLAVSLTLAGAAMAADSAQTHFVRGVSAYIRQDYAAAQQAFTTAVGLAPTSPDAWANYGTASWAAGDTAAAVLGWRQALAIQPAASDLHQRLDLVRHQGPTSPGWVPALPRNASVWLFAALWVAAWVFAWISRRAHPWAGRLPLPLAACAIIVGLVSIELESRISGSRLAVVRHAGALTSDPAIGMDRGPAVATGEIVRIAGHRGVWTRVEATDDRDGWIASSQLLLLSDRRPPSE